MSYCLPVELYRPIVEYATAPGNLYKLSLVSKGMNAEANRLLYSQYVPFPLGIQKPRKRGETSGCAPSPTDRRLRKFMQHLELDFPSLIKEIYIRRSMNSEETTTRPQLDLLIASLLQECSQLISLAISGPPSPSKDSMYYGLSILNLLPIFPPCIRFLHIGNRGDFCNVRQIQRSQLESFLQLQPFLESIVIEPRAIDPVVAGRCTFSLPKLTKLCVTDASELHWILKDNSSLRSLMFYWIYPLYSRNVNAFPALEFLWRTQIGLEELPCLSTRFENLKICGQFALSSLLKDDACYGELLQLKYLHTMAILLDSQWIKNTHGQSDYSIARSFAEKCNSHPSLNTLHFSFPRNNSQCWAFSLTRQFDSEDKEWNLTKYSSPTGMSELWSEQPPIKPFVWH